MPHFASHTGLSPSMVTFSKVFCSRFAYNVAVLQPRWRLATSTVWAVPRSLATTRGIIHLFSLPAGTKMFQFPAFAFRIERNAVPSRRRVVPFGDPRITGHLHLHAAFRSLSRPSSPARAKASSVRPFFLFLCHTYSSVHLYQVAYILSAVFCPTPKGGDTFFIAFACPKCHRSLITLPAHATNKQRQGKDSGGE